ncbi:MAG: NADH-quinone oxidoreductase subunit L [Archangiaceae bacterium]|nr:NADH-quinone oxidoreductase subunit L [Archangiaceae bacterium]
MIDCSSFYPSTSLADFHAQGHGWADTLVCRLQTAPLPSDAAGSHLWMIIALPLLGAFICGVFGKTLGRANTYLVACGSVAGSFLLSLIILWCVNDYRTVAPNTYGEAFHYAVGWDYGVWFSAGNFRVDFGLMADHLSTSMLLVITGIGFLIHLYSTEYMAHDDGYWRFFAYLNLFVAAMLTLVLGDSLVLLFVGWEGVGMCSYLLIGFWYEDPQKAFAGRKAFITNRIGDFGFLLASFLTVATLTAFIAQAPNDNFSSSRDAAGAASKFKQGLFTRGPLSFAALESFAQAMPSGTDPSRVTLESEIATGPLKGHTYGHILTAILLLFLLGAAGKSAQIPLYVWLPDAMAGPTPVSALIHAATMVTAGVYLFCRMSYLVVLSPFAMAVIAVIGGLTALFAALIAFSQEDMKKVLAYSTVSQLGFMFMAVGSGMFWAAFLHVVTHAFFKACLFLGAGSVMHGNADEGNIRKLGGLKREMKFTWLTFAIATCAITGVVPLSGFFSKDSILHGLHTNHLEQYPAVLHFVWFLGLATAACTAFYMTRLYVLAFEGERAKDARVPHAHESGPAIRLVLGLLAFGSVAAVAWGVPFMDHPSGHEAGVQAPMENYLWPVFNTARQINDRTAFVRSEGEHGLPWGAWGMAWGIALVGTALAFFLYRSFFPARGNKPVPALEPFRKLSFHKFYVDELYDLILIRPIKFISFIFYRVIDAVVIDTIGVRGTAWLTTRFGAMLRYAQSGDAQSYAAVMAVALVAGIVLALWGSM